MKSYSSIAQNGPEPATCRMFILSLVLVSPAMLYGLTAAFPAVAIPLLHLNLKDSSWFGSLATYTAPVSSLLGGVIIDKYGRKLSLIYGLLPNLAGWSLLYSNYSVTVLMVGQMFTGLTMGAVLYPMQVYAGECILSSNVRLRNRFMVWIGLGISIGSFIITGSATLLNYYEICLLALALSLIVLVACLFCLPESPTWLYFEGRTGDAELAEKKLGIIQPILRQNIVNSHTRYSAHGDKFNWSQCWKKLSRPDVYKPLVNLSIGAIIMPLNGQITVLTYMINIIGNIVPGQGSKIAPNELPLKINERGHEPPINAYEYGLICCLFTIAGSLVGSFVLPLIGLKRTMVGSFLATILGLLILTCGSVNSSENMLPYRVGAVSLLAFLLGAGIGPMFTSCADMFPADCKGLASIPAVLGSLSSATANKVFPYLYFNLGGYTYCVYAFLSFLSMLYAHILLPEVVGKTLDDINEEFLISK